MAKKKTDAAPAKVLTTDEVVALIKHAAKRKNIPAAGLEAQGRIEESPRIRHHYNPHLPPVLRSASDAAGADRLPELLQIARQRALSAEEAEQLAEALRRHEPWLEWSGKREKLASNFQPQLGQRDVKDRESDLTREPEMVKAYRDTWTLGIHSYLAYLRDRLTMLEMPA